MDRIYTQYQYALSLLVLSLSLATSGFCGVSLMAPDKEPPPQQKEVFGDSRFGSPPPQVEVGVVSGYAHRAVEDAELTDSSSADSKLSEKPLEKVLPEKLMETAPTTLARKGVQEVSLIAGDLGFFPKTVFLSNEVPVRLFVTSASKNALCIMMDSFQVRRQIHSMKIEEITFTPHSAGKYRFYCPVNGMEGTLVVREFR